MSEQHESIEKRIMNSLVCDPRQAQALEKGLCHPLQSCSGFHSAHAVHFAPTAEADSTRQAA